jgi:hypothetical protein
MIDKFFVIVILLIAISSILALLAKKGGRDNIKAQEEGDFCADDFIILD